MKGFPRMNVDLTVTYSVPQTLDARELGKLEVVFFQLKLISSLIFNVGVFHGFRWLFFFADDQFGFWFANISSTTEVMCGSTTTVCERTAFLN